MSDFDLINDATGFANGDEFGSDEDVREYFFPHAQREMFGDQAEQDANLLREWAEKVIRNRWHMA